MTTGCCAPGYKIDSLQRFAYQYVGVTIKGKKYIYINAFGNSIVEEYKKHHLDFTTKLVVVCDGGTFFWGVLFDIETKEFSELAFNGSV